MRRSSRPRAERSRSDRATSRRPAAGSAGKSLIVEVSDTGIGIEPEALPRIFEVFEQGDSSFTRRFGGLGLGLAISRAVAEAHGGRLTAASAGKDRGASFILSLPAGKARFAEPPARPPRPSPVTGARAAEDSRWSKTTRTPCSTWPRPWPSAGTRSAPPPTWPRPGSSRPRRISIWSSATSSLPDGSGLELMDEIKRTRGFPGIAISGFGSDEDIAMSKAAGFAPI